jgi:hypothetical protein
VPVQIRVDQAALPAGTAGRAREDLVTGVNATLTAVGGPYGAYLWRLVHAPIDIAAGVRSAALVSTPTTASTVCGPLSVPGTHLVEVLVDSGSGLGATADDVARITFYAGLAGSKLFGPLAPNPERLPRRVPAFQETVEHNVPDVLDPTGNVDGHARELQRWFYAVGRMWEGSKVWASGRVTLTGAGAVLVRGFNVVQAGVNRTGAGNVTVAFQQALPDGLYLPEVWPITDVGHCYPTSILASGFTVARRDDGGSPYDQDFGFSVTLGV